MERRPENKQEWSASDCREEQGNNTIVRMRQDGTLVAVREVRLVDGSALGNGRLNGIAASGMQARSGLP